MPTFASLSFNRRGHFFRCDPDPCSSGMAHDWLVPCESWKGAHVRLPVPATHRFGVFMEVYADGCQTQPDSLHNFGQRLRGPSRIPDTALQSELKPARRHQGSSSPLAEAGSWPRGVISRRWKTARSSRVVAGCRTPRACMRPSPSWRAGAPPQPSASSERDLHAPFVRHIPKLAGRADRKSGQRPHDRESAQPRPI